MRAPALEHESYECVWIALVKRPVRMLGFFGFPATSPTVEPADPSLQRKDCNLKRPRPQLEKLTKHEDEQLAERAKRRCGRCGGGRVPAEVPDSPWSREVS